jgi:hypothetical protein
MKLPRSFWTRLDRALSRLGKGLVAVLGAALLLAFLFPGAGEGLLPRIVAGAVLAALLGYPLVALLAAVAARRRAPAPESGRPAVCAFCRRPEADLRCLIAGPEEYICDQCVEDASALLSRSQEAPGGGARIRCSFCRSETAAGDIFFRAPAAICSRCVVVCERSLTVRSSAP